MTTITDAKGKQTLMAHDILGRMIRRTNALSQVGTYGHDARDNVVSVLDPKGQASCPRGVI